MQANNGQQGNQGGQKQGGGLSWSQSAPSHAGGTPTQAAKPAATPAAAVKPVTPAAKPVMPSTAKAANANAKPASGGSKTMGIFVSGVIVGLIIGWGWFALRPDTDKVATTVPTTEETGTKTEGTATATTKPSTGTIMENASGALTVASQSAGLSVAVAELSVSVPTWIAIMDNNSGKPGNVLGAAMFFPGQKSGTIELLRATVSGKDYLVGEYVDNGDHIFSRQKDTQVMGITGNPMLVQFSAR